VSEPIPSADLAVVDATVVTMDAHGTIHEGATIEVLDGAITHVGQSADGPARARHVIHARGGIVLPGLVNAHTHLAMTMFRGLADDVDLDRFLGRLLPAEGAVLSAETVAAGTALAVAECLAGGTTSALDMYFFPEAAGAVAEAAGFRLATGPVFVQFAGADRRPFDDRLRWAADLLAATPPAARWVCPHSAYLLDERQLEAVGELAATTRARVHVHACETAAELELVRQRHGHTPIELLDETGLLGSHTVIAHAVHLTDDDLALVAGRGAAVAHCPASNQKLASGFARIPELVEAGVPVALGTDGAASANDLDLWIAMRLAGYTQAALGGPGALPAATLLRMATIDGARALGVDDRTGSIEIGKRADLVVLDPSSPSLAPSYDPVSTAVYAASRGDVRWVVADGRVVVDDRTFTTVDVEAAIAEVRALTPTVREAVADDARR
jgi:5-methylthioadenosine/S-adenosylhomocysteine deaminase